MKRILYLFISVVFIWLLVRQFNISQFLESTPAYPKLHINTLIDSDKLSKSHYQTLFLQTGLGKPAIDKLVANKDWSSLSVLQAHLYSEDKIVHSKKIGPITKEEYLTTNENIPIQHPEFVDIQDGDILISLSTHSLGWRHGHAALVVDSHKALTLEAITIGVNSTYQSLNKWRKYPSVIQLRVKDQSKISDIVSFAKDKLYNIPYNLLSSLRQLSSKLTTYCSHLVWTAFAKFGIDLNSDGSWIVTPIDILKSKELEIVQILGINPSLFL